MWRGDSATDLALAAAALARGELVAFPTETVYGLGGNGLSAEACRAIYAAKGRPSDNPLILHIADMSMLNVIAEELPPQAKVLADAFWPGPLTLILKKKAIVPDAATGGLKTVAVRFPSHPVAQALIAASKLPIAAPSANRSGRPSPTAAWHVAQDFGDSLAGIVDGGETSVGLESTIVDISGDRPVILRPGGIGRELIESLIGPTIVSSGFADGSIPLAPGMKYRHYAPSAPVYLLPRDKAISRLREEFTDGETRFGLLLPIELLRQLAPLPSNVLSWSMGSISQPEIAAQRLFDGLRRLDDAGVSKMFICDWPENGIGLALMNRIRKCCTLEVF